MGKVCKSPVKKWQGSITLCDPLSFPQVVAVEDAIAEFRATGEGLSRAKQHSILLKPFSDCVEIWDLEGLGNPPAPFPATPRKESDLLIDWLIGEVIALFNEKKEEVPEE